MFEDSLVESAALLRTHSRWPALLSLTAQCSIALLVVSLPLLHPELMPMARVLPATLAPPRSPTPQSPPIQLRKPPSTASAPLPAAPSASRTEIFRSLLHAAGPVADAPALPAIDFGSTDPALAVGLNSAAPTSPHIAVAPAGKPHSGPLNISAGITAGHLIAPILPVYPEIARTTRTQGTVVIEAIISRTGHIESAHVLSGPPILRAAALDAVSHARYHPFLLNVQPTEVQTTITIVFRMDD